MAAPFLELTQSFRRAMKRITLPTSFKSLVLLLALGVGCSMSAARAPESQKGPCEKYESPKSQGRLDKKGLREISGVAVSRQNQGVLWVHEDSGGKPTLYALSYKAEILGKLSLLGVKNNDWEDIAIGPCGDKDCLFVGDFGDNEGTRQDVAILRVPEPSLTPGKKLSAEASPEVFPFRYPDGPQDAEALAVTPEGMPIIITKRQDGTAKLFTFPELTEGKMVDLLPLGQIKTGDGGKDSAVTAADLSADGKRLLLRTSRFGWEFRLGKGGLSALEEAEQREVPVKKEKQGESIAYDADGGGFWQISEGKYPHLYFGGCASD